MDEWQQRLTDEFVELDMRLEKLHVFIEASENFRRLPKVQQRLLIDQRCIMVVYRDILKQRIALL